MKRLILLATMMVAVLASCEKHEIRNEVLTEIGFESNVGKQTKAIISGTEYSTTDAPGFGVFALAYQNGNPLNIVMDNAEITYNNNNGATEKDWRVNSQITYYWPNDANTTIDFYAYSPHTANTVNTQNHNKLPGTILCDKTNGLNMANYSHTNMYVDFMTAEPVLNQKYSSNSGVVPVVFKHRMTQVMFQIKKSAAYSGVTFTLNSIVLSNVEKNGTIKNGTFGTISTQGNTDVFTPHTGFTNTPSTFTIFPAEAESHINGAPDLAAKQTTLTIGERYNDASSIIPVTMLPQEFATGNNPQKVTITYTISGNGVAHETVSKDITLPTSHKWHPNKKICYQITVGLHEITFNPTIEDWNPQSNSDHDITVQ